MRYHRRKDSILTAPSCGLLKKTVPWVRYHRRKDSILTAPSCGLLKKTVPWVRYLRRKDSILAAPLYQPPAEGYTLGVAPDAPPRFPDADASSDSDAESPPLSRLDALLNFTDFVFASGELNAAFRQFLTDNVSSFALHDDDYGRTTLLQHHIVTPTPHLFISDPDRFLCAFVRQ